MYINFHVIGNINNRCYLLLSPHFSPHPTSPLSLVSPSSSSLSELPEVHLPIATKLAVVEQLTCITLSPSVRTMSSLLVATVFLCLAATPETHHHISTPLVIGRLIEACSLERDLKRGKDKEIDMLLLRSVLWMWIVLPVCPQLGTCVNICVHACHCVPQQVAENLNCMAFDLMQS